MVLKGGIPFRTKTNISLPANASYQSFSLRDSFVGKTMYLTYLDVGTPANVTIQDLAFKDIILGTYIGPSSSGVYDILEKWGKPILVMPTDTLTIRGTNSGTSAASVDVWLYGWYVSELS